MKEVNGERSILKNAQRPFRSIIPYRSNTRRFMTTLNTVNCVLCGAEVDDLTNHYVNVHQTESYVSRITRMRLNELPEKLIFLNNADAAGRICQMKCIFCDELIEKSFQELLHHYTKHTGEYAYQCRSCKRQEASIEQIKSHQKNSRWCKKSKIVEQYKYAEIPSNIYIYACSVCSYVQLHRKNVEKHLYDHHLAHEGTTNTVHEYILAEISYNVEVKREFIPNEITNRSTQLQADEISLNSVVIEKEFISNEISIGEISDLPKQLQANKISLNRVEIKKGLLGKRLSSDNVLDMWRKLKSGNCFDRELPSTLLQDGSDKSNSKDKENSVNINEQPFFDL